MELEAGARGHDGSIRGVRIQSCESVQHCTPTIVEMFAVGMKQQMLAFGPPPLRSSDDPEQVQSTQSGADVDVEESQHRCVDLRPRDVKGPLSARRLAPRSSQLLQEHRLVVEGKPLRDLREGQPLVPRFVRYQRQSRFDALGGLDQPADDGGVVLHLDEPITMDESIQGLVIRGGRTTECSKR